MYRKYKHKFHATSCNIDSIKFSSKKEAAYYQKLILAQKAGMLLFFLRQVPFHLPGNLIYRLDFMEFWDNGDIIFTEVKGFPTKEWLLKKKLVESTFPIKINII